MISRARPTFWRLYHALPARLQAQARQTYGQFSVDPSHPGLRFKKLAGQENLWSVRLDEQYRAVGYRKGDTIDWIWIGTDNDFDNVF